MCVRACAGLACVGLARGEREKEGRGHVCFWMSFFFSLRRHSRVCVFFSFFNKWTFFSPLRWRCNKDRSSPHARSSLLLSPLSRLLHPCANPCQTKRGEEGMRLELERLLQMRVVVGEEAVQVLVAGAEAGRVCSARARRVVDVVLLRLDVKVALVRVRDNVVLVDLHLNRGHLPALPRLLRNVRVPHVRKLLLQHGTTRLEAVVLGLMALLESVAHALDVLKALGQEVLVLLVPLAAVRPLVFLPEAQHRLAVREQVARVLDRIPVMLLKSITLSADEEPGGELVVRALVVSVGRGAEHLCDLLVHGLTLVPRRALEVVAVPERDELDVLVQVAAHRDAERLLGHVAEGHHLARVRREAHRLLQGLSAHAVEDELGLRNVGGELQHQLLVEVGRLDGGDGGEMPAKVPVHLPLVGPSPAQHEEDGRSLLLQKARGGCADGTAAEHPTHVVGLHLAVVVDHPPRRAVHAQQGRVLGLQVARHTVQLRLLHHEVVGPGADVLRVQHNGVALLQRRARVADVLNDAHTLRAGHVRRLALGLADQLCLVLALHHPLVVVVDGGGDHLHDHAARRLREGGCPLLMAQDVGRRAVPQVAQAPHHDVARRHDARACPQGDSPMKYRYC
eukprot:Rhum_TRINITY_DN15063_c0_g2::Rhum_TRINITY_DN15063_c0_g2_i1::g.135581::m.135581